MWLFRIILGVFYIWAGYWFTYNFDQGIANEAIILFMWIFGITKIVFCFQDIHQSLPLLKYICVVVATTLICPTFWEWLITAGILILLFSIVFVLDGVSLLFTGKSFATVRGHINNHLSGNI